MVDESHIHPAPLTGRCLVFEHSTRLNDIGMAVTPLGAADIVTPCGAPTSSSPLFPSDVRSSLRLRSLQRSHRQRELRKFTNKNCARWAGANVDCAFYVQLPEAK